MKQKYIITLTKSEVNKLHEIIATQKKTQKNISLRRKINELYVDANNIILNGGGA